MAIGYFIIRVLDRTYGVQSLDATALGCSFMEVGRRLARRGEHVLSIGDGMDVSTIVKAYLELEFGVSVAMQARQQFDSEKFLDALHDSRVTWAPDGDAAFDDGSHVLQMDVGTRVRLIAFTNAEDPDQLRNSVRDLWIPRDEFYGVLAEWHASFREQWERAVRNR